MSVLALFKSLWRRKLRSTFALGGVALSIAALVALLAATGGFQRQFEAITTRFRGDVMVLQSGALDPLLSELDYKQAAELARIPEVVSVYPLAHLLTKIVPKPAPEDQAELKRKRLFTLFALPAASDLLKRHTLAQGRYFRTGKQELVLGELAAQELGYRVGDLFRLNSQLLFKVVGTYRTGVHLLDLGGITSLKDYFTLRGSERVNLFVLELKAGRADIPAVTGQIKANFPQFDAIDSAELLNHLEHLKLINGFALAVAIIAALIAVIGVLNTMLMSVHERVREIGLLSALGWSRLRIMTMIIGEGVLLALMGGILGSAGGLFVTEILLKQIDIGLVEAHYPAALLFEALLISLGVGLLGALLPAWQATRITPVEALRYE